MGDDDYITTPPEHDEYYREHLDDDCHVYFRRIAVVEDDFDDFNLLPLAVKHSDTRARKFLELRVHQCAELDAIPSTELRRRVESIIESHIDVAREEWERLQRVEEIERETLDGFIESLEGAA